jgi:uncharacterized SAM-binding protein YcdF (DUF218 family)
VTDQELAQVVWDFMRYEQPLEPANIILGLGYADRHIADHCVSLYRAGFAPRILFSGDRDETGSYTLPYSQAEMLAERALQLGVPETDLLLELHARNTGENIRFSYELLEQKGLLPQKVILVHEPYMLRRDFLTFEKQWPGKKPNLMCSAVDITMMDYAEQSFETFSDMVHVMVGDLQRIQQYPKQHYEAEDIVPPHVLDAYKTLVTRGYTNHLLGR